MCDLKQLYEVRKKLHEVPEIAFTEFKTQEIIMMELKKYYDLHIRLFEPTGILYEYTKGEGDYILFRADMDGLPIQENTNCSFKSKHNGFCHACGHDVHVTILIGLIKYVVEKKLKKNILFLFQPAEEGYGGAIHIINTGVFKKYSIKAAYSLHVTSAFPTGTIGLRPGIMFGIPQEFNIEFFGKSGHVATPQKGRDAFLAAISFYTEMIQLLAKKFPAQEPILFHIGKISSGTVRNIIPDLCVFEGTFRCLKMEIKEEIINIMQTLAKSIEISHNIEIKITLLCSYAPVINDETLTKTFIEKTPKDIKIINTDYSMVGEDFGFFTELYPSVLFWLGTNCSEDLHSDKFLVDEKSIDIALKVYKNILE